jgi:dethiobiotin synthetase
VTLAASRSGAPGAGLLITSTGTSAGKTFVSRGLARALVQRGLRVAAIKPIETGCAPLPLDALALARAARAPGLADAEVFYRAPEPLAPYAVELTTGQSPPDLHAIADYARALEAHHDRVLVEAAGGLLVPIDRNRSMADLAVALGYPLLLVTADRLGVLSHALTACEAARARGLRLAAIVLTQLDPLPLEPSSETNARILHERVGVPVLKFPFSDDDDSALASAAISCKLLDALGWSD